MDVLVPFVAVVAALVAFWSAGNVERLKLRFDKVRRAYDFHFTREYELYGDVYPKLLEAYYVLIQTRSLDSSLDIHEELAVELDERTPEEVQQARRRQLDRASELLGFMSDIEKKKPFIHGDIYQQIEIFWQMGIDTSMVQRFPSLYKPPMKADRRVYSKDELENQLNLICAKIKSRLRVIDDH